MELREYQITAIEKIRQSMKNGKHSVVLQASCGAGKTIISSEIARLAIEKDKKVLFLVNRRDLVKQTVEKYQEYGLGNETGIIMAGFDHELEKPIQVASLQTYGRRLDFDDLKYNAWFHDADLVIYDECFNAGTLIDDIPIESIRVGDRVNSYNHNLDIVEKKEVLSIFKSRPTTLCRVLFKDGSKLICTEGHPFYVDGKYLTANALHGNMRVLVIEEKHRYMKGINYVYSLLRGMRFSRGGEKSSFKPYLLLQKMFGFTPKGAENRGIEGVPSLWGARRVFWAVSVQNIITCCNKRARLLFGGVFKDYKKRGIQKNRSDSCGLQSEICFSENEKEESDVKSYGCGKNDGNKKAEGDIEFSTKGAWRKRTPCACAPAHAGGSSWLADGGYSKNKRFWCVLVWGKAICEMLQNRYCKRKIKNSDRSGRFISQRETEINRREKNIFFRELGVESVEIFKQTGDGRFGGVSKDGYVYNLEVKDNNNYFAAGVLVHNCHSCNAKTYRKIIDLYKEKSFIIGLSATPMRGDSTGLGEVFDDIVDCIPTMELIEKKFLVPMVYYAPSTPDLDKIKTRMGDYEQKELGKRVDQPNLIGDIYLNWMRIASDRQTLIFATNVKHSKHIRDHFRDRGISIEHIDAHTDDETREDIYRRFENGDIQVLTNVGICCEGSDLPFISALVIAKPTKVLGRWLQMAGRGMRPLNGKQNCILLDHAGCVDRHGFVEDDIFWTLDGKEKAAKKRIVEKKEPKPLTCGECSFVFVGKKCSECGTEIKDYGKKIAALEADLVEIGKVKLPKATMDDKRKFYGMLEYERRMRGFKSGWKYWKYKAKFGVAPRGFDDSIIVQPDAKFLNFITYQNIKYHKGLKKREMVAAQNGS